MKAVFLDRDGIINVDYGYVSQISEFTFTKKIIPLLKHFKDQNFVIFICTNQSGIARKIFGVDDYQKLTKYYVDILKINGIDIEEIQTCPHHPDFSGVCNCRKPKPGMYNYLTKKYNINCDESIAIGDSCRDLVAAKSAGIKQLYLISKTNDDHCKLGEQRFDTIEDLYINVSIST